jgi:hypothetical protein
LYLTRENAGSGSVSHHMHWHTLWTQKLVRFIVCDHKKNIL